MAHDERSPHLTRSGSAVRMLGRLLAFAGLVGVAAILAVAFVGILAAPAIGFFARLIDVAL